MTKQEALRKYSETIAFASDNNLHSAIVFVSNAITGDVESRTIYSPDRTECYIWLDKESRAYVDTSVSFGSYLDGVLIYSKGLLFK